MNVGSSSHQQSLTIRDIRDGTIGNKSKHKVRVSESFQSDKNS